MSEHRTRSGIPLKPVWLSAVLETARDEDKNMMGASIEAIEAGATMGEIGGATRMAYSCPHDPHGLIESPI